VTDEDIIRFKGGVEAQYINGLQSVAGKVSQLAAFQTFTGNPNKIGDLLKMYSSVTKEDVMRVYNQYIKGKHAVIVSVLPKGQEKLVAADDDYKVDSSHYTAPNYGYDQLKYAKATDNFDRSKKPGNGPNPVVKVPAFWKKNLPNGIKIIGAENTELPLVTITVTLPGGHLLQAKDMSKAGLASFFSDMMNEDTKNYSAEQLAVELQKLGSSIRVSSETDGLSFSVQALKKNLDKTLDLLQERMLNPVFTDDAFKRNQKQTLEGIRQSKTRAADVATDVIAKINFGAGNILGVSENGTEATVKNITLDDIKNYYSNNISSQGAKVVIVGDVKESEIMPKLGFLSKLPNKKIDIPAVNASPLEVDKSKIFLVDIPKAA
ncbi:MAG TPA: insulinase family protein, partial [Chitinophagaceae bacterium]|nr:insulinase family protein [Chitinophagaceae bacterium]